MNFIPSEDELNACPESVVKYVKALERSNANHKIKSNTFSHHITARQKQLAEFIADYIKENEIAPTFEEMSQGTGLGSKSGIHRLIKALEERGVILRLEDRARCIQFVHPKAWGLNG